MCIVTFQSVRIGVRETGTSASSEALPLQLDYWEDVSGVGGKDVKEAKADAAKKDDNVKSKQGEFI